MFDDDYHLCLPGLHGFFDGTSPEQDMAKASQDHPLPLLAPLRQTTPTFSELPPAKLLQIPPGRWEPQSDAEIIDRSTEYDACTLSFPPRPPAQSDAEIIDRSTEYDACTLSSPPRPHAQSDEVIIDQLSAFYSHYDQSKIGKAEIVWKDLQMLFMENAATELEQALMIKYGCNLSTFTKMKSTEVVGTTTNNRWFENTVDAFLPPAYTQ
jgi:hypothetical protein